MKKLRWVYKMILSLFPKRQKSRFLTEDEMNDKTKKQNEEFKDNPDGPVQDI